MATAKARPSGAHLGDVNLRSFLQLVVMVIIVMAKEGSLKKGCFLSGVAQIIPLIMEVMMTEMARMIIVICPRPQFLRLYGNLLICKSCASLLSIGWGIRTRGH